MIWIDELVAKFLTEPGSEDGYDLEQATNRGVYANFRIGELYASKDKTFMELRYPGGEQYLKEDEAYGDVDGLAV